MVGRSATTQLRHLLVPTYVGAVPSRFDSILDLVGENCSHGCFNLLRIGGQHHTCRPLICVELVSSIRNGRPISGVAGGDDNFVGGLDLESSASLSSITSVITTMAAATMTTASTTAAPISMYDRICNEHMNRDTKKREEACNREQLLLL